MRRGTNTDRRIRYQIFTPRLGPRRSAPPPPPPAVAPTQRRPLQLKRYRLPLDVAKNAERVPLSGNVFWVTSASDSAAVAQVQFVRPDGTVDDLVDVAMGFRTMGAAHAYDAVLITSAVQAGKYLNISFGTDPAAGPFEGDTI